MFFRKCFGSKLIGPSVRLQIHETGRPRPLPKLNIREFVTEPSVLSNCIQNKYCRAIKELSISASFNKYNKLTKFVGRFINLTIRTYLRRQLWIEHRGLMCWIVLHSRAFICPHHCSRIEVEHLYRGSVINLSKWVSFNDVAISHVNYLILSV